MAYRRRYRRRRRRYYRPRLRRRRRARRDSLRRAVQKVRKVRKVGLDVQLNKLQKFRRNYYTRFELDNTNYYLNEEGAGSQTYGQSFLFDFFTINHPRRWLGLWETAKNYRRVTNFYQKYTVYIRWAGLDRGPTHVENDIRPHWREVGLYVFMYPLGKSEQIPSGIYTRPLSRLAELPGCKVIHLKPPQYRGTQVRKMTYTLSRRNVHPKAGKDDNYDQIIYSRDGFDNFSMTILGNAYDFRLQFVYMLDTPVTTPALLKPVIEITVKKKAYLKFSEPNYQDSVRFEGDGQPDPPDSMEE